MILIISKTTITTTEINLKTIDNDFMKHIQIMQKNGEKNMDSMIE